MTENPNPVPEWVDGKKINEVLFCREFLEEHPMVSVGGAFFTVEGLVSDENLLKKQVYDKIKGSSLKRTVYKIRRLRTRVPDHGREFAVPKQFPVGCKDNVRDYA